MNKSFRTAFWAMCLGLTVPMVLFIGAELVSGNQRSPLLGHQRGHAATSREPADGANDRAPAGRDLASRRDDPPESRPIKARSNVEEPVRPTSARRPSSTSRAAETPESTDAAPPRTPAELETIETDLAESSPPPWSSRPNAHESQLAHPLPGGVQLGPQLETDHSISGINVGLETRKLDRGPFGSFPPPRTDAALARDPAAAQIEARLTRIQQHLDQLTNTLLLQTQQKQQEQLQQTTQLMQQVQQAGRLQDLERQLLRLQETADAMHDSSGRNAKSSPQKPPRGTTTKVYYLRHLSADELLAHISPLLTHGTGRANAAGIPLPPGEIARSGKNAAVNPPRLIVTDSPEVHVEIERQIRELDVPPVDITLDARVFALTLGPDTPRGFDFSLLKRDRHPWVSSAGDTRGATLKLGILHGLPDEFVNDLERLSPLRTVATPRAIVPERQPADLVIGAPVRVGESIERDQNSQTSAGATRLRIRPFRTPAGVRLEVSQLTAATELAEQNGLQTGQIVVQHGQTALVSGLVETRVQRGESDTDSVSSARRERIEYIVLLTPILPQKTVPVGIPQPN